MKSFLLNIHLTIFHRVYGWKTKWFQLEFQLLLLTHKCAANKNSKNALLTKQKNIIT